MKEEPVMGKERSEIKAREILEQYGLHQSIPFDPIKVAQLNGIEVKNAVFKDNEILGIISKKQGSTTIYVNSHDSYNRKRFTVAHELGHYFLHLKDTEDSLVVDMNRLINGLGDEKEKEANRFAAAVLMDEVLVKSLWNDFKSVQVMADIFKVSFEAMSYRLDNLGII
jgi:Zn-dependent peptidase ImmA (M78 family)